MTYKVKVYNYNTNKFFIKRFKTEHEKDKFIDKVSYSKYLVILEDYTNAWNR